MKYFLVAGERSGDLHGANLILEIIKQDPEAEIVGWGGDQMESAGAKILKHYRDLTVMGFWEVFKSIWILRRLLKRCQQDIYTFSPQVLILIDFGGFNLRVAAFARHSKIKICYYIAPKLWAWRPQRISGIRKNVDHMLVILPFERDFYKTLRYNVTYVGNPVMEALNNYAWNDTLLHVLKRHKSITFLPGSRAQEIKQAIPVILKISTVFDDYQILVSGVNNVDKSIYEPLRIVGNISIVFDRAYELIQSAEAVVVTSGTATLETALIGKPQVVVYKTSWLTYLIARKMIRVPHISLVNLISGKEVVRELIQGEYNAVNVASELETLLSDVASKKRISEGYSEIRGILGEAKASEKAAKHIIDLGRS
ncbi:lipid-A-disaccharide synthase [Marinoscillum sp.]|uniref:lipid-A-disaccharide synthase n=1 Tax=Marinoscillum sp. TaxID=2024838 RepID=UPI003BA8E934